MLLKSLKSALLSQLFSPKTYLQCHDWLVVELTVEIHDLLQLPACHVTHANVMNLEQNTDAAMTEQRRGRGRSRVQELITVRWMLYKYLFGVQIRLG